MPYPPLTITDIQTGLNNDALNTVNLKELSKTLGLSQTTVSRALNGYPEVAEATRIKVAAAAAQHGYRPNPRAKGLATGRAMAVGHVIPVSNRHEMVNPVFADFIAGASEVYLAHGLDMVISTVPDDAEATAYRSFAAKGKVDGIIVHGPRNTDPRIRLLRDIGLPFVVHGRVSAETTPYDWVDVNNRSAFRRATDFLLDLGHRRIALLNGLLPMDFAGRRLAGFTDAMQARGLTPDHSLVRSDDMTEAYGYQAAQSLLLQGATAFLVSSMIVALGVRRAVEETGARVGRDVSIVTHDDDLSYLQNGGTPPIFTATRSSVRQAGRLCAERLIQKIADPDGPPKTLLLEAELLVGASTGPAPQQMTHALSSGGANGPE